MRQPSLAEAPMRVIGLAVVLTLSFVAGPIAAEAQQAGKVYRIGVLGTASAPYEPMISDTRKTRPFSSSIAGPRAISTVFRKAWAQACIDAGLSRMVGVNGQAEERLLSQALSPFGVARRNQAIEMGRLYIVLHCFENELRTLIRETLEENEGADWADKLPSKAKKNAEDRQQGAFKDSWLEGEKSDILGFVDFGHLATIIIEKWQFFEDIIPSQHWVKQRMDELEKARHFIAHSRVLLPSEFQRIYMYVADWNRVIGL